MNPLRHAVSKNKRRYEKNGFDLDLSYINDHIIAMGFPSKSIEGMFRNPVSEVIRFLDTQHKDHYKIYNLCSERSYDAAQFHHRVVCFPFDDHNAPAFDMIRPFCADVKAWLDEHPENVAVIHCKAGKGRTGVMICAFLLYNKEWQKPEDAMNFYAAMRTHNMEGVTIPSQIRYIHYWHRTLEHGNPPLQALSLESITLHSVRASRISPDFCFVIYAYNTPVFIYGKKRVKESKFSREKKEKDDRSEDSDDGKDDANDREPEVSLSYPVGSIPLQGDIKLEFSDKGKRLFSFWFNTNFVDSLKLTIPKAELDKAVKDCEKNKQYPKDFRVEMKFTKQEALPIDATNASPMVERMKEKYGNDASFHAALKEGTIHDTIPEMVLNLKVKWQEKAHHPCKVVTDLLRELIETCYEFSPSGEIGQDNLSIVKSIGKSSRFNFFSLATAELQMVILDDLSPTELLAFWLNAFNLLSLHVHIKFLPNTLMQDEKTRLGFYKTAEYVIGGYHYSLSDIEHGILKALLPSPAGTYPIQYKKLKDKARASYAIQRADPRVNFVLSYGTKSSPRIRIFDGDTVETQLAAAEREFITSSAQFIPDKKAPVLQLPATFGWFAKDFGKKDENLIKYIADLLPNDKREQIMASAKSLKLKYVDYDWTFFFALPTAKRSQNNLTASSSPALTSSASVNYPAASPKSPKLMHASSFQGANQTGAPPRPNRPARQVNGN